MTRPPTESVNFGAVVSMPVESRCILCHVRDLCGCDRADCPHQATIAPVREAESTDSRPLSGTETDESPSAASTGGSRGRNGSRASQRLPIIVGIDLSLTSTGIAVMCADIIDVQRIRSVGRKDATVTDTAKRIDTIGSAVALNAAGTDLAVIEAPSFGSRNGSQHERGGLWWDVIRRLVRLGVPIATVSPQCRAKYATGRGNAGKDEVLAAVVRRYPDVDVTGNDVADALVLAAMGARWLGAPIDDLPKTHLAAMDGAKWPEIVAELKGQR